MYPKSRDSQSRAAFTGTAFFAALLALSFSVGCDAEGPSDVDDADDVAPSAQHQVTTRDARGVVRPIRASLAVVSHAVEAPAPVALTVGAEVEADENAIDPRGAAGDGDAADDGDDGDDVVDDAPSCADGADMTAPTALGRIVTIPAGASGMEPISPTDCVEVVDDCDAVPLVELLWVRSDEPESGVATDDRFPDVSDLGCGLGVRAEHADHGDGRVYTIGWRASDRGGNATQGTCTILVEREPGVAVVDSGTDYEVDLRGLGCP
jgi:hypothetical protein